MPSWRRPEGRRLERAESSKSATCLPMTRADLLRRVMADRLEETKVVIAGVAAGEYPPIPSDECPRCPHYFICQAIPE